jgi:hypothetical protein
MYIYKTTNKINEKIYIGLSTMTEIESKWYFGSGNSIKKAIKKYGIENFEKEILEDGFKDKEDLSKAEIKWIEYFKSTYREIGYNLSPGGDLNPEYLKKPIYQYSKTGDLVKFFTCIDDAIKELEMKNSDIYKKNIRESRPIKKFWWSIEEKSSAEISQMNQKYLEKRRNSFSDGNKKRYLNPIYAEDQREHMRRIQKMVLPSKMSEETKDKISKSLSGRRWYTNRITGKQVQGIDLPESEGWILGRLKV